MDCNAIGRQRDVIDSCSSFMAFFASLYDLPKTIANKVGRDFGEHLKQNSFSRITLIEEDIR